MASSSSLSSERDPRAEIYYLQHLGLGKQSYSGVTDDLAQKLKATINAQGSTFTKKRLAHYRGEPVNTDLILIVQGFAAGDTALAFSRTVKVKFGEAQRQKGVSASRRRWIQSANTQAGAAVLPSIKRVFEALSVPRWRKLRLQLAWFDLDERPFNASQLLYGCNVEEIDASSAQMTILTLPTEAALAVCPAA